MSAVIGWHRLGILAARLVGVPSACVNLPFASRGVTRHITVIYVLLGRILKVSCELVHSFVSTETKGLCERSFLPGFGGQSGNRYNRSPVESVVTNQVCKAFSHAAGTLSMFLVGIAQAADVGAPLIPEITVASAGVNTGSYSGRTAIAADAAGNFVVFWDHFFRRFAANGTSLSDADTLPILGSKDSIILGDHTAAMDAAGDFVVAWVCPDDANTPRVCAQVYKPGGTLATIAPIIIYTGTAYGTNVRTSEFVSTSVAMSSNGDFVVGWSSQVLHAIGDLPLRTSNAIQTRRYHLNGNAYGNAQTVHTANYPLFDQAAGSVHVLMASDGAYVVTWSDRSVARARFYSAAGKATSKTVPLPTWTPSSQASNASAIGHFTYVASLADDGDLLLAFDVLDSTNTTDTIYLRRCTMYCQNQGTAISVATRTAVTNPDAAIALGGLSIQATTAGGSIVSWGDQQTLTLYGKSFTASDQPAAAAFTIGTDSNLTNSASLSTVLNPDGNLLAAWGGVKARLFQGP